jgi:hypothetical protein
LILTGARRGRNCLVVVAVPAKAGRAASTPVVEIPENECGGNG